jgi:hypothetical protein
MLIAPFDLQHGLGRPYIIEIGPSVDWGRLPFRPATLDMIHLALQVAAFLFLALL